MDFIFACISGAMTGALLAAELGGNTGGGAFIGFGLVTTICWIGSCIKKEKV